jgi:hypothetical protein
LVDAINQIALSEERQEAMTIDAEVTRQSAGAEEQERMQEIGQEQESGQEANRRESVEESQEESQQEIVEESTESAGATAEDEEIVDEE